MGFGRWAGSSPLARGTPTKPTKGLRKSGLIPARAGNTCVVVGFGLRSGAHPRSRGEHALQVQDSFWRSGSSPLARGTPAAGERGDTTSGLIPARAGNTENTSTNFINTGAHPRSRGEHAGTFHLPNSKPGSSPLARGTRAQEGGRGGGGGLIPARAGNTFRAVCSCCGSGAHPRSRGEHLLGRGDSERSWGSSPLARGTPCASIFVERMPGLIPARAGNTYASTRERSNAWAHPRSRGEHIVCWLVVVQSWGSSPLARGTHLLTWDFTPYISKIESLWSQSLTPEYTISSHY